MSDGDQRDFITGVLRDMEGNAVLSLSSGRTEPTEEAPYGKLKVDIHHWFRYPDELDAMVAFAEKAEADRRDAYLSPVIYGDEVFTDRKGNAIPFNRDGRPLYARSKRNALYAQTVYMDSDSCPPEAFRIPPSRHVVTSDGHGHDYWFLPQPVPVAIASTLAHKITTAHKEDGCDPSGWSANKVLRLPTFNTTYDEISPFKITWDDDDVDPQTGELGMPKVYDVGVLEEVYGDVEVDRVDPDDDSPLPPVPALEGLPEYEPLLKRIPASEKRLNDLLFKKPKLGPGGWRSEQRFALLLELKRHGFTDEETIVLAWNAPVSQKFRDDGRGVDGLWWELQVSVKRELAKENGAEVEPAPAMDPVTRDRRREAPRLLNPHQMSRVESRHDLVTLYLEYAKTKVRTINMPYHVVNAWTVLALGLSEAAEIPKDPKPLGLNLYSFTIGNSSTGKDEAVNTMNPFIRALYPHDDPSIAAASSREDLIENLIDRSDRVTYIDENEADGLLSQIKGGGYTGGLFQYWTRAYDGDVPSLGRVGKKHLNQPGKHAVLTMHLVGTPAGLYKVLDKDMFYTGYMARQIYAIGEDNPTTKDSLRAKMRRGVAKGRGFDGVPQFYSLLLADIRSRLRLPIPLDQKRAALDPTDEAIDLHAEIMWKIHEHFEKDHEAVLWRAVIRRMSDIIWKIAGLSAASNDRSVIGTFDVEVAAYYAQTWIGNTIQIADELSDTYFSKQCDEIEKFIASRESRRAELGQIYRFRKGEPKRVTDEYLNSLAFQGRVEEWSSADEGGPRYWRIKERRTA